MGTLQRPTAIIIQICTELDKPLISKRMLSALCRQCIWDVVYRFDLLYVRKLFAAVPFPNWRTGYWISKKIAINTGLQIPSFHDLILNYGLGVILPVWSYAHILTIITRENDKLITQSLICCRKYNWAEWSNPRHTHDRLYITSVYMFNAVR